MCYIILFNELSCTILRTNSVFKRKSINTFHWSYKKYTLEISNDNFTKTGSYMVHNNFICSTQTSCYNKKNETNTI